MRDALEFVAEVERDFSVTPLFLGSGFEDVNKEALSNQHSMSLTAEQAGQLTTENLHRMMLGIMGAKRQQLLAQRGQSYPMQFYCWHDEQAAQLRFSLISASAAALPFGCPVRLTADLNSILSAFLSSKYHDGITWDELAAATSAANETADDSSVYYLDVWKTLL
ncbi:hypothetical protein [Hymenobacter cellulosivorans]|uniref:Uncharacterized protein n=1 Tax=Hymenobacter cellulosivorans TaxID=2932249 RepID=A0ABY4F7C6_9BACT|nr:hypothetical protein [Hymenobacter cellulosivorans]UOQ52002.1 hypothetical protein MUN80_19840 [Hymenobacter cellulosivorans]